MAPSNLEIVQDLYKAFRAGDWKRFEQYTDTAKVAEAVR